MGSVSEDKKESSDIVVSPNVRIDDDDVNFSVSIPSGNVTCLFCAIDTWDQESVNPEWISERTIDDIFDLP